MASTRITLTYRTEDRRGAFKRRASEIINVSSRSEQAKLDAIADWLGIYSPHIQYGDKEIFVIESREDVNV